MRAELSAGARLHRVPPQALPEALAALARFRAAEPDHARWIADGAPRLTDAAHVARFGEPYHRSTPKRASARTPLGGSSTAT